VVSSTNKTYLHNITNSVESGVYTHKCSVTLALLTINKCEYIDLYYHMHGFHLSSTLNHVCGVMVSVLSSGSVDREFEPRSGQNKDYEIGICYFSAKHAALRSKSKDWLARNQNNV
jgi:hypothetical protein